MFAHRLGNLSMRVAMTPARLERPTRPGDFLIAVSGSGATFEVLQRLNGARRHKLRTAALTAERESSATKFVDTPVVLPACVEPRQTEHFSERNLKPAPPSPPSESTFSLNALLVLETIDATVPWAHAAFFELMEGGLDLFLEKPSAPGFEIGGLVVVHDEARIRGRGSANHLQAHLIGRRRSVLLQRRAPRRNPEQPVQGERVGHVPGD